MDGIEPDPEPAPNADSYCIYYDNSASNRSSQDQMLGRELIYPHSASCSPKKQNWYCFL